MKLACHGTPQPSEISDRLEHVVANLDKTSNKLSRKYEIKN